MDNNKNLVSLAELRKELRSGDLVFFQGLAADSVLIRDITGGLWSHCAMIISGKDIDCHEHERLLFESSITAGQDIGYKSVGEDEKTGVMLVNFDQRLEDYARSKEYSLFGIRRLESEQLRQANIEGLKSFVLNSNIRKSVYPAQHQVAAEHFVARELANFRFTNQAVAKIRAELEGEDCNKLADRDLKQIIEKTIEAVQDNLDDNAQDKIHHNHAIPSRYFCSELVVDALMHMDILKRGNAAGYTPSDLSGEAGSILDSYYSQIQHLPSDLGIS